MMISVFEKVEIWEKGENDGYQHFHLFPPTFEGYFSHGHYKLGFLVKG